MLNDRDCRRNPLNIVGTTIGSNGSLEASDWRRGVVLISARRSSEGSKNVGTAAHEGPGRAASGVGGASECTT